MQQFHVNISNEQVITASLFYAAKSDILLLIIPAAGVVQSFYRKFAEFLQANHISTITFDYSGIGRSLQGPIRAENCRLADWGARDLEALLSYAIKTYPTHKIVLLGHSIGGQLIGLAPSAFKAGKVILVAAQSGYWKFWKGRNQIRMWANWYLVVPLLTKAVGYLPAKKFSRMENLPKNVAADWAEWCRTPHYLFGHITPENLFFDRINCPLVSISIEDDRYAPQKSVAWLTAKFKQADTKSLLFCSANFEVAKIGHFALFTDAFRDSIWKTLLEEVCT